MSLTTQIKFPYARLAQAIATGLKDVTGPLRTELESHVRAVLLAGNWWQADLEQLTYRVRNVANNYLEETAQFND